MSAPEIPDGPYYLCGQGRCSYLDAQYKEPHRLRWIKGKWRCLSCFENGFGRDVLHEWDTATTLAEYLEDERER